MDNHAQHQEIIGTDHNMIMVCPNNSKADQRKPRPQPEQALKCPRCDSTNTKFCYYNNYSLSQPRYFCKSCRRYWTQGGTLRNVPVGGGCRKNKRSSSSSSSSSSKKSQDHHPFPGQLSSYDHDLGLAFARLHKNNNNSCSGPAAPTFNDFDFSVLGMPSATDVLIGGAGGFGYNNSNSSQAAALYYGNDDNNNMGGIEHGSNLLPYDHQYGDSNNNGNSNATTTAVTVTTMKQELFGYGDRENNESSSRILWGYPNWQMNSNAVSDSNMADFDSAARESWNSFNASSSWHGLLNSPLM